MRILILSTAAMLASTAAAAGPVYFHKAGANREAVAADFAQCQELAGGVSVSRPSVYSSNIYAMAATSLFSGFFGSRERRKMTDNVMRTCMADKGYARVEAPPELRKQLGRLAEKERVDRLFSLAGAAQPVGKVLPK